MVGGGRGERRALPRLAALRARRGRAAAEVDRRPGLRDRPRPALGAAGVLRVRVPRAGRARRAPAPRSRCASRRPRAARASRSSTGASRRCRRITPRATASRARRYSASGAAAGASASRKRRRAWSAGGDDERARDGAHLPHSCASWRSTTSAPGSRRTSSATSTRCAIRCCASSRPWARSSAKLSRQIVADPRPVGGSLFRIHRDVRFAKDKSPYKTHAGDELPARGRARAAGARLLPAPRAGRRVRGRAGCGTRRRTR